MLWCLTLQVFYLFFACWVMLQFLSADVFEFFMLSARPCVHPCLHPWVRLWVRPLQNLLRYSFEISYMDSSSKNNLQVFFLSLDYPPLWSYAPFKGS